MRARLRVGALASGRGSNLRALIEACRAPDYPCEIALVLVNVPGAPALDIARAAGISARLIDHREFASRAAFDAGLDAALRAAKIDIVCLAGFMRLLSPGFVAAWEGRVLNIHPSLLPAFKGLDTHRRALEAGVAIHGCTVHLVTAGLDEGPILARAEVAVRPGDDVESLAARVLEAEHLLYPKTLREFARARLAEAAVTPPR